jgi:hypothetical protein
MQSNAIVKQGITWIVEILPSCTAIDALSDALPAQDRSLLIA